MTARHRNPFGSVRRLAALLALTLATLASTATAADDEGFTSLFNGKDLAGWEGDTKYWSVEDGLITARTTPETLLKQYNTFLIWRGGMPSDFELRLSYKIKGGNSGVQYRSKIIDPARFIVGGYQADIAATPNYTGIVYEERGRGILAERGQKVTIGPDGKKSIETFGDKAQLQSEIKNEGWNEYVIVARGNHLTQTINGKRMSELIDNQADKAAGSGVIALQVHQGPPMVVQFKDLRIKEFK
jgi:hypothetical protein